MTNGTWILLLTFVVSVMIPVLNNWIFKVQNRTLEEKLCKNNKQIIFVNNDTIDLKNENYKSSDFFHMHNDGDLKLNEFEYTIYHKQEDCYLNKNGSKLWMNL